MEDLTQLLNFKAQLLNEFVNSKTMRRYLLHEKKDYLFNVSDMITIAFNSGRPQRQIKQFLQSIQTHFELSKDNAAAIDRILNDIPVPSALFDTDVDTGESHKNIGYNRYPENRFISMPFPFKYRDFVYLADEDPNTAKHWLVTIPDLPKGKLAWSCDYSDLCLPCVPAKFYSRFKLVPKEEAHLVEDLDMGHRHLAILNLNLVSESTEQ